MAEEELVNVFSPLHTSNYLHRTQEVDSKIYWTCREHKPALGSSKLTEDKINSTPRSQQSTYLKAPLGSFSKSGCIWGT